MPRIDQSNLDNVFFLYRTRRDAEEGNRAGGTGFFVGVQSAINPKHSFVYAVTCKHVVKPAAADDYPAPVIRVNNVTGGFSIFDLSSNDWTTYGEAVPGEQHDIAMCELGDNPLPGAQFSFLLRPSLLTRQIMNDEKIGHGDDVFMVGRHVDQSGRQKNTPAVRFGNISMMPGELLRNEEGFMEESFIVEMRSIPGFSGSPVWVVIRPYAMRVDHIPTKYSEWLLGMFWSDPPYYEYQRDVGDDVRVFSGMCNVLPAWHIDSFLDCETFRTHREQREQEYVIEAQLNVP